MLALADQEPLSDAVLVERVWPTAPPDPVAALAGLRAQLGGVLDDSGPATDAAQFAVLTRRAEGEAADGDLAAAEATLVEALALWRGAALEDVRDTPYLAAEAHRLEEARLTAVEDRLDLATRQGRHGEILDEVRALADTYPTRERLWGLLMTALYRSGRRDEAITVYAEARDTLADELGIEPGEALQQLEAGMLRNDPALGDGPGEAGSPQPRRRARIPVLASSTFGREDLCAEVAELVVRDDVRLVTLTGIGGSGKSRVATLVAGDVQGRFSDVVFLQVTEGIGGDQLLVELALALDCPVTSDAAEALSRLDASRATLVVLDNLEALAGGPDVVRRLLDASAALTLLVTSRLPLHASGERELPVPPLEVPGIAADLASIQAAPSVLLFVDRATSAEPSFRSAGQERDVAEVCALLDGLPLALELAAARVKLGSLDRIIDGLRSNLDLLATGSEAVPERQRAMATAIRWSYDRLTPDARLVCDRLALFERGFTIEAVEAVCADLDEVIEAIASIVDARLVRSSPSRADVRFVVLGTVRAFARERLLAHPDLVQSRERLAAYLAGRVEEARTRLYGADGNLTQARFDDDAADIAATVDWALDAGRRAIAVQLVLASLDCWVAAGRHNEALGLTLRVLDHVPGQGPDAARLLAAAAMLSHQLSDHAQAASYGRQALDLADRHGDRVAAVTAKTFMAATLVFTGDLEQGEPLAHEAAEEATALDLYPVTAQALQALAMARLFRGDYAGERAAHEATLTIVRAKGDLARTADTLNSLAEIALDDGDDETAAAFAGEAVDVAAQEMPSISRDATITLARAALVRGDLADAGARLGRALELSDRLGQTFAVAQCLRVGGCLAVARGRAEPAVRFFAAAQALSPSPGGGDVPPEQDLAAGLAEARAALGEPAARRAWTLGGGLPLASVRAQLAELLTDVGAAELSSPG